MAYQQPNGPPQRYYSQSNDHSHPSSVPQSQTPSHPYATAPMQRTPSFDAGDDAKYFDNPTNNASYQGQAAQGSGYASSVANSITAGGTYSGAQSNLGSRHSQFSVGSSEHSIASRASSHGSSAMSGYQHQYRNPSSPAQPSYNPQHFVNQPPSGSVQQQQLPQQQAGYNSQTFGSAGVHQPYQQYNPAAYSSPTTATYQSSPISSQWTSGSFGQSYLQHPAPSASSLPPPTLAPAPPPRGHDNTYPAYQSPQYSDSPWRPTHTSSISSSHSTRPTEPLPPLPHAAVYNAEPHTVHGSLRPTPSGRYSQSSQSPQLSPYSPATPFHNTTQQQQPQPQPPDPPSYTVRSEQPSFADRMASTSLSSHPQTLTAVPAPPIHRQPSTSPRRTDTLSRHPQDRPLPGPPIETDHNTQSPTAGPVERYESDVSYDDIMKEVEAAVMGHRPGGSRRRSSRVNHAHPQQTIPEADESVNHAQSPELRLSPDVIQTHTNGQQITATGTGVYVNYGAYSDDSDAEAAAGVAALQMAEEEEATLITRQGINASITSSFGTSQTERASLPAAAEHLESSSDSDFGQHDIGLYGGGYDAHMHYGEGQTNVARVSSTSQLITTSGSFRSSGRSTDAGESKSDNYEYTGIDQESSQARPSLRIPARVDAVGTGGLSDPALDARRRLSFDNGDEATLTATGTLGSSASETSGETELQDLFFHPGMSSRPLPAVPVLPTSPNNNENFLPHLVPAGTYLTRQDQYEHLPQYPTGPAEFNQSSYSTSAVPRSSSLNNHIPQRNEPIIRSKTDSDRVKSKQYESSVASATVTLDLPTIPAGRRKKFNPTKLSTEQFRKCTEPWALSAIVAWIRDLSEEETDLKEQAVVDAIVGLFTHKVPTMNTADAETLGSRVVKNMLEQGALIQDEEWVKFGSESLSGVLWQLTGQGCYSSRLHVQDAEVPGRCYAHHCMRTLKKINLKTEIMEPQKKAEDWATFYKIGREVFETHSKKEVDRQNNLHEIVTTEDAYIAQLDVLRSLYRDQLATCQPSVVNPKRLDKFLKDIFGKVDAVKQVNEDHLLAQLKYRQMEQGPFIAGFSDIFREWIRKAKAAYIDYAATFPNANYLVRREAETNLLFKQFLNQARENKLSQRLSWDTYLKAPITRIQRYTLMLSTVLKNMEKDCEEKTNLMHAIDEIKLIALECDSKVGEMTKQVDLLELGLKLKLRPEMERYVTLHLEHLGREIIFQSDLLRPRTKRFALIDIHAILFDHYLVLAKIVTARDPMKTVKHEIYDVSKLPIPMDLLTLESTNDDPVMRSAVKGITAVAPPANNRANSQPTLNHTNTTASSASGNSGTSSRTLTTTTSIDNSRDDRILYPFKIKHLGQPDVYTLYSNSMQNRQEWCEKIIEAKTKHATSLYAQNAEPFRLRVLSDSAFGYSEQSVPPRSAIIRGTPLDRAIREVEKMYEGSLSRPLPISRATVNCASVFYLRPGKLMCAVGTDYGVFVSDYDNPRGWSKIISAQRVTQIAVFEEFNILLLISEKSLIAYHLDVVCPPNGSAPQSDSQRRAPQKLSGNREVGFFAAGRMKDRLLVFYKKRDGISSTFKVLEPVLQKSGASRPRFLPGRRSQTDFFREFDEFYIPAESYSINLFHSYIAISTSHGIEVLTLDKKHPWSVPYLRSDQPEVQAHLSGIATRIKDLRPLGMFRLSDSEFLLAFAGCAVYINKHGDVSRSVVMEFVGTAKAACLCGKFLILCNDDFVEVRNAMNGRLRQVIPGRNVTLLDDGSPYRAGGGAGGAGGGSAGATPVSTTNFNEAANAAFANAGQNGIAPHNGRTVKICMQHPEYEKSQIIVELIENEGQKD